MYTVYKLVNNNTGKTYTGCTSGFGQRVKQHFKLLKDKKHHNQQLQSDFLLGHSFSVVIISNHESMSVARADEMENIDSNSYNIIRNCIYTSCLTPSEKRMIGKKQLKTAA